MLRTLKFLVMAALFVIVPQVVLSQGATTSVRGSVTDSSGASVRGASVLLENKATGLKLDTVTNGQGEYAFLQVVPGDYTITVSASGFGKQVIQAKLLVAQPATVDAKLTVASDQVTVEVASTTQVINTTDATIGNAIPTETIMALPSEGRRVEELMSLQPGVSYLYQSTPDSRESRSGAVSGARADQTNLTLDGLDNNDQIAPAAFVGALRTPMDAVQEFRVTTSNANADTGRSSGGQANVVTRSGTNQLHGALYEYNRNNWGEANDFFNKNTQLQNGQPNTPPKLIRNTYGARLGGPLKRDKLFLFGNYEGQRTNEAQVVQRTVPGATLRAGTIRYYNTSGNIVTLSRGDIASMDADCTPQTGSGTCPWGQGVNPNVLALFANYPQPNASLASDPLNLATVLFTSPQPITLNTYVSRLDYNLSDKHQIFVRGLMMNDTTAGLQYYPGQPPATKTTDNSKGIAAGYTWSASANFVNNLRYGFTRQSYAVTGVATGSYSTLRGIDPPESATSRNTKTIVPLHNVVDDFSYTKGRHTIQAGINWRHFDYESLTDANSWNNAIANASYLTNSGIAGNGGPLDPGDVATNFSTNYDYAVAALLGLTTQVTNRYNYSVSGDGKTGSLLGTGVPVARDYRTNEFEWYVQDAWKPTPNLTLIAGLRHTILQTPWEKNGQQVQPNIDLHQWFINRAAGAALGQSIQPEFGFSPSGKAHNGKPFYPMNWGNFAPRLAFAWSPATEEGSWMHKLFGGAGKSSIRAGFGMYYDHFGQGVVSNFSRYGSFSLGTALTNPANTYDVETAPRFTGLHNIPAGINPPPASTLTYPQQLDPYSFLITYGLDDHLKTPYSEVVDFSIQRELPGGFTLDMAYVGRFGRHLMQASDMAQPLNLVDPRSGMDYYTAATQLAKYYDEGRTDVPAIPYFENLFPDAKGLNTSGDGAPGKSATQNFYDDVMIYSRGNETNIPYYIDFACYPGCGGSSTTRFWPDQYSSLYAWSSVGSSSYNAGQFILRHPMKHGIAVDFSYTLSQSMDLGSDTESNYALGGYVYGFLLDAFNPRKNWAVSDFDTRHLVNANWVLDLPFGKGHAFGGGMSPWMNTLFGGWQLDGIARWSSGLPFSVYSGEGWATNWEWASAMVKTGPIKMRRHLNADGLPVVFDNPVAARDSMRLPYPGEAGQRNNFRGDGYFSVDSGLHKAFVFSDRYRFNLAWETFNVTNTARFDPHAVNSNSTDGTQLGLYTGTLNDKRKMQFSGRFEF